MALLALVSCQAGDPGDEETLATPIASITTETLALAGMRTTLELYGRVDYAPQQMQALYSTAEAVVEQLLVIDGQSVTPGQALARLRPSASALLDRQKASIDLAAAEQELARTQRMFAQQLATNADLDTARQSQASASAAALSARTRVPSDTSYFLHAPTDAVVASIEVAQGDIVAADSALLHLANGRDLSVRLAVEPTDLSRLQPGQPVLISPIYAPKTQVSGQIAQLVASLDSQSRLAQALVSLSDTSALLPGSMVRAEVELQRRDAVLSVPHSALLWSGDTTFVYTTDGHSAHRVDVSIGAEEGDRVEVLSGLQVGDQVVVEGNYGLEDEMAVQLNPAAPRS